MKVAFGFIFLLMLGSASLAAQHKFPSLSPLGTVNQRVGNTNFTISYERPAVRGRKIFGGLVPWDKVWRTGAGENTNMALERNGNRGYSRSIQIGLYEDKGMLEKALEIAKLALEDEENAEEKQYWQNDIDRLEKLLSEK